MEQNSGTETKKLDKLHLNKLLNRQFFTIKEQLWYSIKRYRNHIKSSAVYNVINIIDTNALL